MFSSIFSGSRDSARFRQHLAGTFRSATPSTASMPTALSQPPTLRTSGSRLRSPPFDATTSAGRSTGTRARAGLSPAPAFVASSTSTPASLGNVGTALGATRGTARGMGCSANTTWDPGDALARGVPGLGHRGFDEHGHPCSGGRFGIDGPAPRGVGRLCSGGLCGMGLDGHALMHVACRSLQRAASPIGNYAGCVSTSGAAAPQQRWHLELCRGPAWNSIVGGGVLVPPACLAAPTS